MGKEGPKDRLEMVSREPTWAKKVPRKTRDSFKRDLGPPEMVKRANLGKEGPKARLEMVSREPTWVKEGPKDRLEMVSREPTWAKKVPRID